ncbi:hypothetical protein AOX55_00004290 (plasmid) [Sinorhizobium fredii CCBAU 25509]|nr:hypothetical protein AOX55_00004290 [Sinorhizobium fredii CCBAU 25509]
MSILASAPVAERFNARRKQRARVVRRHRTGVSPFNFIF